ANPRRCPVQEFPCGTADFVEGNRAITVRVCIMFLKHIPSSDLIEVLDIKELVNPCRESITGRSHAGEEMQEPAKFEKAAFIFPSGEALPQCWINPDYQKKL
ncbi:MAG: hypothetical protein L0H63_12680, partial [Nitrococcus sp.]|nr:hypothetical protein [Nitrococcus sp.]